MFSLTSFVLVPLFGGILAYLLPQRLFRPLALLIQTGLAAGSFVLFRQISETGSATETIGNWTGSVGITLAADLLGAVMVAMTTVLFLLLLIYNYSRPYVDHLFITLWMVLQSLLLGIYLSTDLFNIYVLIEVSTIIITLLILFKKEKRSVYDGMIYLMVNIVAMTFFLLGLGMLYRIVGVLDFPSLRERIAQVSPAQLILPCALMLTAASLKAAVFPLFSWLPKAHGSPGAPSIVSAVLSGLYVKAGIYLLIRLQELFEAVFDLGPFFMVMGFITAFTGIALALSQKDIKRILAYSTVSQMGLILVGIGQGTANAFYGSLYHMINHALFKSTLFLISGLLIEVYGTRDIHKIRGVFRRMPVIATAAVIAMLGITGAPLFNGSVSKYLIETDLSGSLFAYGLVLINLGTVMYFLRFSTMFWGSSPAAEKVKIEKNRIAVITLMAVLCLAGGLFGVPVVAALFPIILNFSFTFYLEKLLIYLAILVGGFWLHRIFGGKMSRWTARLVYEPGFNQMCLAIIIYFSGHVFYLHWLG